jgi:hypothetical protein
VGKGGKNVWFEINRHRGEGGGQASESTAA